MAVYCQNLMLGALSSRSALSMLVGALFKTFGLFLHTTLIMHSSDTWEKMGIQWSSASALYRLQESLWL